MQPLPPGHPQSRQGVRRTWVVTTGSAKPRESRGILMAAVEAGENGALFRVLEIINDFDKNQSKGHQHARSVMSRLWSRGLALD